MIDDDITVSAMDGQIIVCVRGSNKLGTATAPDAKVILHLREVGAKRLAMELSAARKLARGQRGASRLAALGTRGR